MTRNTKTLARSRLCTILPAANYRNLNITIFKVAVTLASVRFRRPALLQFSHHDTDTNYLLRTLADANSPHAHTRRLSLRSNKAPERKSSLTLPLHQPGIKEDSSNHGYTPLGSNERRHSLPRSSKRLLYILLNTVSTIIVVFLNKVTFRDPQLRLIQISVAIWHFLTTFLVLLAASLGPYRVFKAVRLPIVEMLPICVFFTLFLILNNLSLTTNPVGFYQLAKILTSPALVALDYFLFRKTVSYIRLASVGVSCCGIALTNGASARSNPLGASIAVAAFMITALYQLWIGKKIKDLRVSAPQLLLNQAPISVLMLLPLVPFFDTVPDIRTIPAFRILAFIGSGLVASMINLSQFLIIEGTSALTFNIVGMVKTIVIVAIGWWIEGKSLTTSDLLGVALGLGGAWIYASVGSH